MSEINLEKWDMTLHDDFSMAVYASRRSGKSTLVRYIFESNDLNQKFDFIICISKNQDALDYMSEFVSGDLFFDKFDKNVIKQIVEISKELEMNQTEMKFLIILDDTNCNEAKNDETLNDVYSMGRHLGISIIWITQHVTNLSTTMRNNSDYLLIGRCGTATEKKAIIDNFLMGSRDEDVENGKSEHHFYRELIKKYTKDYTFIVVIPTSQSTDFKDVVQFIRAEYK